MNVYNKTLRLLPILGIAFSLAGFLYLTYETYTLNEKRQVLKKEVEELEASKKRLTEETKVQEKVITIQDSIISHSDDPKTVEKWKEVKDEISQPAGDFFTITPQKKADIKQAERFEKEGFNYLIQRDVTNAITAFTKSENAMNGYHQVYEISRYLKKHRSDLTASSSEHWKETYRTLHKDYSYKMPADIKSRLQELSN